MIHEQEWKTAPPVNSIPWKKIIFRSFSRFINEFVSHFSHRAMISASSLQNKLKPTLPFVICSLLCIRDSASVYEEIDLIRGKVWLSEQKVLQTTKRVSFTFQSTSVSTYSVSSSFLKQKVQNETCTFVLPRPSHLLASRCRRRRCCSGGTRLFLPLLFAV